MKSYVLAFAHQIPFAIQQRIVLVEKKKPAWQAGLLNLPGGSIEAGETPTEAASRELREETSIRSTDAQVVGLLTGVDWEVFVCRCLYHSHHANKLQEPKTTTNETVLNLQWQVAMADTRLIPNLRIIIPFCMAGASGWTIRDHQNEPFAIVTYPLAA